MRLGGATEEEYLELSAENTRLKEVNDELHEACCAALAYLSGVDLAPWGRELADKLGAAIGKAQEEK